MLNVFPKYGLQSPEHCHVDMTFIWIAVLIVCAQMPTDYFSWFYIMG